MKSTPRVTKVLNPSLTSFMMSFMKFPWVERKIGEPLFICFHWCSPVHSFWGRFLVLKCSCAPLHPTLWLKIWWKWATDLIKILHCKHALNLLWTKKVQNFFGLGSMFNWENDTRRNGSQGKRQQIFNLGEASLCSVQVVEKE
jgi:hypothetical protein